MRALHRPTLTGLEHLPAQGPFLLVANHSAGMGLSEILSFVSLYLQQAGPGKPLAAFALPIMFRVFPFSRAVRAVGAVPSTYDDAHATLEKGIPLLIFPGGNHETLRPIWQAHRVDFGGRVGFLRIARHHRIPVVPLGIRGSHFTAPMLLRSNLLATILVQPRLLGVRRWGISLLGVLGAAALLAWGPGSLLLRILVAWFWLGTPLTLLPWIPWTIRMRVGAPIPSSELFRGEDSEQQLQAAGETVQSAVQSLVDGLGEPG
jgi:1-acyl-sn-glycerol-3-phosphate acyltransferase